VSGERADGPLLRAMKISGKEPLGVKSLGIAGVGALVAVLCLGPASAAEIRLIAAMALKDAYGELVPQYERATGDSVNIDWSPTVRVAQRLEGGEKADIVILTAKGVDDLIAKGVVAAGSRVDLARSPIGVAIRSGAPRPDLSSAEGVRKSLLASRSIVISGGTSSFYLKDLFQKMGIAEAIAPHLHQYGPESGTNVAKVLAQGEGDLGFTQAPQFLNVKGIDYLGPLPAEIQDVTLFSAGVVRSASAPDEAKRLLRFLTAPESDRVLKKYALNPG
jgi:molybdate transport system substrate-binding protein